MADGYFASFLTPDEFERNMTAIRSYAAEYGRANARIESGLILLCRLGPSRERARAELEPVLRTFDRYGNGIGYSHRHSNTGPVHHGLLCERFNR